MLRLSVARYPPFSPNFFKIFLLALKQCSSMAVATPTSLPLSLDPSFRSSVLSSFPSISLHRYYPLPLSVSSVRCAPAVIAASSSPASSGGVYLDALGLYRLQVLNKYIKEVNLDNGCLEIRPMEENEIDPTVQLLAESFAESMGMPQRYVPLLAFLVRQYVVNRRLLIPHASMLVGFYKKGDMEPELWCTAEVSFDIRGANAAPPTPLPPLDCPYICNMAVKKEFRRRGIGLQLLSACEELISQMKTDSKVYLHCRVTDTGPLKMYKKAGYKIVKTDSIMVWLSLQRRKHLLVKELLDNRDAPLEGQLDTFLFDNHVSQ